jgi:hypothetical protein
MHSTPRHLAALFAVTLGSCVTLLPTASAEPLELGAHIGDTSFDPGFRIGFGLGERAVLATGLDFSVSELEPQDGLTSGRSFRVAVPLELLVRYLAPADGVLTPTTRIGIAYRVGGNDWNRGSDMVVGHSVGLNALLGATYFPDHRIGIRLEVGPSATYERGLPGFDGPVDGWRTEMLWRLGVTMRL